MSAPTTSSFCLLDALDSFSAVYYGALRVKPESIAAIQARIFEQFPTVTVINAADILEVIQGVMDRVSLAVRFVAAFAIFGGLVVSGVQYRGDPLPSHARNGDSEDGGRDARKGRPDVLPGIRGHWFNGRFHWRGLAAIASAILIGELLDTAYVFSWSPVFAAAVITAVLTVLTGWIASYGVLNRKPLDILRQIES